MCAKERKKHKYVAVSFVYSSKLIAVTDKSSVIVLHVVSADTYARRNSRGGVLTATLMTHVPTNKLFHTRTRLVYRLLTAIGEDSTCVNSHRLYMARSIELHLGK